MAGISHWPGLLALVMAMALAMPAVTAHADELAALRPNILLIVADDLGYGELGCYGGTEIPTPHLDALAAQGVRFTNGYVTAPFCAASRAGLLTGRYQTRFGFEFNPIGAQNADPAIGLPVKEKTLADRLQASGYATALIGKWHLGGTAAYDPQRRGFDEFFGFLHEGHSFASQAAKDHTTWLRRLALPDGGQGRWVAPDGRTIWSTHMGHREPDYDANNPILRNGQPVTETENLTTAFTREACDFIKRHHTQPFFLCLTYNAVHSPMQAQDDYLHQTAHIQDIQRRIFAAMLMQLDAGVGDVVAQLNQYAIQDRTLVLFLSDNGGPTKELTSSNAPLRGGKGELYEGGIRVPFLLSWPAQIRDPAIIETPVSALDIAATVQAVTMQLPAPGDGSNLLDFVRPNQESSSVRKLYWRVGNRHAIRHGEWKLIRDVRKSTAWELYHLATDVAEATNLANEEPDRVQELSQHWEDWNAQQAQPLW